MSLNLSARATAATRIRCVYRITTGALSDDSLAALAVAAITSTWRSPGVPAFMVTPATDPTATAGGVSGLLASLGGRQWFSAIDVKTDYTLASMTWAQLLEPVRTIDVPGIAGLGVQVQLDHAESVATSAAAVSADAQLGTAQRAAAASAPAQLADVLDATWKRALVIAVLVGALFAYVSYRRRAA